MKHPMQLVLFSLLITCWCSPLGALDVGGLPTTKRPAWVEPMDCNREAVIDTSLIDYGYYYLLVDHQKHEERKERYHHYAFHIINTAGLTDASQLQLSWSPSYESFSLHAITVWRDGVKMDWTRRVRWKEIQREESLDMLQYNEMRTMLLVFEDIRVNDIVEYEYSIQGANPIFGDMAAGYFSYGYNYPMETLHFRLLVRKDRDLSFKQHARDIPPAIKERADGLVEYSWLEHESPAIKADTATPSWMDVYPWIEYSQWQDWKDVQAWGARLFETPKQDRDNEKIKALAKRIIANAEYTETPHERLIAFLRFVQNDIRYFGMEIGINSHKPRQATEVADSRFGDCKDKAQLFAALARLEGWICDPVLVDTKAGKGIKDWLPSPFAFNHVIVKVTDPDGESYWFDPTISYQGGTMYTTHVPQYGWALPVTGNPVDGEALQYMPEEQAGALEVYETYTGLVTEGTNNEGAGTLEVCTVYKGKEADSMRWRLATTGRSSLEKSYLDFYQRLFPGTEKTAELESVDDPLENRIEVFERYTIPALWTKDENERKETLYVYPHAFSDYMKSFENLSAERKTPLALSWPYVLKHQVTIHSPSDFLVGNESHSSDNPWYSLSYMAEKEDKTMVVTWDYRNLVQMVSLDQYAEFRKNMKGDYDDWIGYTASIKPLGAQSDRIDWPSVPFWAFVLVVLAVAFTAFMIGHEFGRNGRSG